MKRFFLVILKTIWIILGIVAFYLLCGFLIPYIKVPEKAVTQTKYIDIYILTNGVHTDLVVPVKSEEIDWSKEILFENTLSKKTDFKYLSIGWGDKGFYLDTPTWAELKPSTAVKAAFWMSESAMHCTFYEKMTEGEDCKKLTLTREQYRDLIFFIREKFDRDENGEVDPATEYDAIDHVLLSRPLFHRIREVRILHEHDPRDVTDHFPIVVKLAWPPAANR